MSSSSQVGAMSWNPRLCTALVSTLVIIAMLASSSQAQTTVPDLSSMFSLKNLGEYNQLIDCMAKIREQFTQCNNETQAKGEAVLKFVNEKSEMGTLLKCCGVWLLRDCWEQAASQYCTPEQVTQLHNMPQKMMPGIDTMCHKYPPGATACYTPHIVLGAILSAALILVIVIIVVGFFVARHLYRRRQGSTKIDAMSGEDEAEHHRDRRAEKVKLTSNSAGTNGDSALNNNNIEYIDSEKGN